MDVKFKILGSSSAGNSGLLQVKQTRILIDAGLSARKLQNLLLEQSIKIEELDAVFLTHEHNDHSAGIRGLSRFQQLPVFATVIQFKQFNPNFHDAQIGKFLKQGNFLNLKILRFIRSAFRTTHTILLASILSGEAMIYSTL